ncbi:plasmid stabilization system protein ParE [Rhodopseudomonas rhenobacensis]|uniref:Plasmid stabilization system protein ParE n=1 Tax=Rhodopseudomonas rhenobacensis TaxID=87461 RepID=A0A7W8DZP9_9BRAD|nr:plasmid stabilization system protein ParE [Rhodopseudomonas rhenobacensis]
MKLRFTIRAAAELDEVLSSIERQSPQGAQHIKQRLFAVIALLRQYPQAGRLTNKAGLRRVVAYPYPYQIYYRAGDAEIVIHGVRHSARRPLSRPK